MKECSLTADWGQTKAPLGALTASLIMPPSSKNIKTNSAPQLQEPSPMCVFGSFSSVQFLQQVLPPQALTASLLRVYDP